MTLPIRRKYACPFCGEAFSADVLATTNTLGPVDGDLREHAVGEAPEKYMAVTCPRCGYTAYDFSAVLSPREKEAVRRYLDGLPPMDFGRCTASNRYALLVNLLKLRDAPVEQSALAALRGAWMAEDEGASGRALELRREAARLFSEALEAGRIPPGDVPRTAYVVGELHRLTGSFREALSWFARARAGKGSPVADLCRKQEAKAKAGDAAPVRLRGTVKLF